MVGAYDQYVQMPVMDLYDTQMMLAAVNVAKDMYLQGQQEMKDFATAYGDFYTPIEKDQNYYNSEIGRVRGAIEQMYANGINPAASKEGRALLGKLVNSVNIGNIAKIKASAENAREFIKNRGILEAEGLYDPVLAKYDGDDLSTFSTLDSGKIWGRRSPTKITDIGTFGQPYYMNIKPNKYKESKNGIERSVEEITMDNLRNIARENLGSMLATPQGQMMYKYYKDLTGDDEAATNMFVNNVANGQKWRVYRNEETDDNYIAMENLRLKKQSLAAQNWYRQQSLQLKRELQNAKLRGDQGGPGTSLTGKTFVGALYHAGMAKAWGADGFTKDIIDMPGSYEEFGMQAPKIFNDFGKRFAGVGKISKQQLISAMKAAGESEDNIRKIENYSPNKSLWGPKMTPIDAAITTGLQKVYDNKQKQNAKFYEQMEQKYASRQRILDVQDAYRKQFSIPLEGKEIAKHIGTPLSDNAKVVRITDDVADRIYGDDDIISNTQGYTRTHTTKRTKAIRDAIKHYGADHTTVQCFDEGYSSLRKGTNNFSVMPRVKVTCTDKDGKVQFQREGYIDVDISSYKKSGGGYVGNYKEERGMAGEYVEQRGEPYIIGNKVLKGDLQDIQFKPNNINAYPDMNNWISWGPWDVDTTSKLLHVPYSDSGAYLPDNLQGGYDPFMDDEDEDLLM